jgi:hypothetical protein
LVSGLDLSAGGTNVWELSDLTTASEGVNFDQIILTDGNLALGANARLRCPSSTPPARRMRTIRSG